MGNITGQITTKGSNQKPITTAPYPASINDYGNVPADPIKGYGGDFDSVKQINLEMYVMEILRPIVLASAGTNPVTGVTLSPLSPTNILTFTITRQT